MNLSGFEILCVDCAVSGISTRGRDEDSGPCSAEDVARIGARASSGEPPNPPVASLWTDMRGGREPTDSRSAERRERGRNCDESYVAVCLRPSSNRKKEIVPALSARPLWR